MACKKCGAKGHRPTVPSYTLTLGPESETDERTAEVQFRYHVSYILNGNPVDYYASTIATMNFSLIADILSIAPDSIIFRSSQKKAQFYADY